jgi:hypothetical protein
VFLRRLTKIFFGSAGMALTTAAAISGYKLTKEAHAEDGMMGVIVGLSVLGGLSLMMLTTVITVHESE